MSAGKDYDFEEAIRAALEQKFDFSKEAMPAPKPASPPKPAAAVVPVPDSGILPQREQALEAEDHDLFEPEKPAAAAAGAPAPEPPAPSSYIKPFIPKPINPKASATAPDAARADPPATPRIEPRVELPAVQRTAEIAKADRPEAPAVLATLPSPDFAGPDQPKIKSSSKRHIWICADDYGISPGVNEAIRDLLMRGRINATSVLVVAPSFGKAEALPLKIMRTGTRQFAIGLHLTLTAPFAPLSEGYRPLRKRAFLPLKSTLRAAMLGRLRPEKIAVEVGEQIRAFTALFGALPDFVDGHQHVQVFPQIREAVVSAVKYAAPNAWIRQCGSPVSAARLLADPKGLLINRFSRRLRARAARAGVQTNPAFTGTYRFSRSQNIAKLFPRFLRNLPDGGVVMCHPGHVDDELRRLDPLTDLREKEYAYLAGDEFGALLEAQNIALDRTASP